MAMTLEETRQSLEECEYLVRMFTTDREWEYSRRPETDERWIDICEENKRGISATASHFAIALANKLKVPVGILNCNQGASVIRAWISPDVTEKEPIFGEGTVWHPDAEDDEFPFNKTSYLYLERLQYLHPYKIKGVIWYQGESDSFKTMAHKYRDLFEMMVRDWRSKWLDDKLPFIVVQLAPYNAYKDEWFYVVRECQFMASETIPNVGVVTIGDVGDFNDIHPRDKKTVGERLALYARGMIYGEEVIYRSPVCRNAEYDGEAVILTFSDVGNGLYASDELKFHVKDIDGNVYNADYEILGDKVRLVTNGVKPDEVLFCFDNGSCVSLFSSANLPAIPFRIKI